MIRSAFVGLNNTEFDIDYQVISIEMVFRENQPGPFAAVRRPPPPFSARPVVDFRRQW